MTINISEVLDKTDELIEEEQHENILDQEEFLNILFNVQNISWEEFVSKEDVSGINIMRTEDWDPPIREGQVLLGVVINGHTEIAVSTNEHRIPYVEGFDINVRAETTGGSKMKGIHVQYVSKEPINSSMFGIDCYIPYFNSGKKIIGIFNSDTPSKRYFFVSTYPITENIHSPERPSTELRATLDPINDVDKILFIDASTRIEKMSESWVTVQSALIEINNLIENTIDPNYIVKLMKLNKAIVENIGHDSPPEEDIEEISSECNCDWPSESE